MDYPLLQFSFEYLLTEGEHTVAVVDSHLQFSFEYLDGVVDVLVAVTKDKAYNSLLSI